MYQCSYEIDEFYDLIPKQNSKSHIEMVKDKKKSGGTSPLNINNIPTTILEHEILSRLGTKDIVNLRRTNNKSCTIQTKSIIKMVPR